MEDFWEREKRARLSLPVDLGTIAYLNIPIDRFPFGALADERVRDMERQITEISKKPLLNLTGKTNTELREIYGSPNLEAMQEIGDDFDTLTVLLNSYAQALADADLIDEAITVLEYAVSIKTDVSSSYTLLGDCYYKKEQPRRIEFLKEQIYPLHLLRESIIIDHLNRLTASLDDAAISPDTEQKDTEEPENNPDI